MKELPASYVPTREGLHALACYVIAPARKADCGRIGLRSVADGFGTPELSDGSRLAVIGADLVRRPGPSAPIRTVRAAAEFVGIELSDNPGVGSDLPPYDPDRPLTIDSEASLALGAWYRFGHELFERLGEQFPGGSVTEAQLWPEHFDYAVTVTLGDDQKVNVGFSAGDGFEAEPYLYVGPHDASGLDDSFWNAPFGACLRYANLAKSGEPAAAALRFVTDGLDRLSP